MKVENITTNFTEKKPDYKNIQWTIHTNKLGKLDEMDKFLETHNLTKLTYKKKI